MKHNIWHLTVAPGNGEMIVNIATDDDDGVVMQGNPVVMKPIIDALVYGMSVGELVEVEEEKEEYLQ